MFLICDDNIIKKEREKRKDRLKGREKNFEEKGGKSRIPVWKSSAGELCGGIVRVSLLSPISDRKILKLKIVQSLIYTINLYIMFLLFKYFEYSQDWLF